MQIIILAPAQITTTAFIKSKDKYLPLRAISLSKETVCGNYGVMVQHTLGLVPLVIRGIFLLVMIYPHFNLW